MQSYDAKCVLDIQATLGEGPSWDDRTQTLLWVDIENHLVNRFSPKTGENQAWTVATNPSFAIASEKGDIVVGTRDGIVRLDPDRGKIEPVVNPGSNLETHRFNDAKCDPRGRLFAGTISDKREPDANCYRFAPDFSYQTVVSGAINSNGMCWSADQKTMYYIDTGTKKIDAFDYDVDTGEITNRRTVVAVPDEHGKPDGMTIDQEGKLWTGMWGGEAICRWDPGSGQLLGKVSVAAPNVTSCCFGGENLDELYITTARNGLSDEQLAKYPQAGGLFVARPSVAGAPTVPFPG